MRIYLAVVLTTFAACATAQQRVTLSGFVKDASTGESLIGAGVSVPQTTQGAYTNEYGFYSMAVTGGTATVRVSYLGYAQLDTTLELTGDMRLNVDLKPKVREIKEVVVRAQREDNNVQATEMGKVELSMDKIKTLPAVFGEVDVLKTIQLLPGVQSGGEGSTGLYVRGGGPDQNLIQLDEATVYNSAHLFGFFSVFNPDALLNATLYKGGIPANYGGRVSSVLDITMKEGNNKQFHGSGGIGLIASRLTLEGPLVKNKASFIVSGRRTYIDALTKPFIDKSDFAGSGYYFYDFNAKANYKFSDKDRLFLSGYFGRDVFSFKSDEFNVGIPWGNATTTLRWNHLFTNKLFMNASAIYNDYNFEITAEQAGFGITLFSGIKDNGTKWDFDYFASGRHEIQFGAQHTYHVFIPNTFSGKSGDVEFKPDNALRRFAHEIGVYALDKITLTEKLEANVGLRYSAFAQVGPYTQYQYDFLGQKSDSIVFNRGDLVKWYNGLEPRLLLRYSINEKSSVKASFNLNNQYIHLVANNGSTLPTDLWVPSTSVVKPQVGYQYAIGYFRNFKNNMFETSVELYYKDLRNQIEFREGYTPGTDPDLERNFVFGNGDSKGLELYVNKREGRMTGWVSYTLSYTNRKFELLNDGEAFPYRFDRRHVVSVAVNYQLGERWTLGSVFVYNTGIAYTLPIAKYFIEGKVVTEYSDLNTYRLADYHRVDISLTYEGKTRAKLDDSWNFSVYNVYNRQNPYFVYNEVTGAFLQDPEINIQARQVSLFPVLPSATWNFKF